jgi:hypothetical protein
MAETRGRHFSTISTKAGTMSKRHQSQQKSYRRQLQLETLEKRCMLALTSFVDIATLDNCNPPVADEIVAVAKPVVESGDGVVEDCPPLVVEDVKLPVDETTVDIDVAPVERIYTMYGMQVTDVCEPTTDDVSPENVEEISDLVFTTTVFEDVQRTVNSEPVDSPVNLEDEANIEVVSDDFPVIYTMSPVEDTKPPATDDTVDTSPTKPQEQPAEEPVIYTLGGSTESVGTTTPTAPAVVKLAPAFHYAGRSVAQPASSPNGKSTRDNLVSVLSRATSKMATSVNTTVAAPVSTTVVQQPQPVTTDVTMPVSKAALKQFAGGRIGNRR